MEINGIQYSESDLQDAVIYCQSSQRPCGISIGNVRLLDGARKYIRLRNSPISMYTIFETDITKIIMQGTDSYEEEVKEIIKNPSILPTLPAVVRQPPAVQAALSSEAPRTALRRGAPRKVNLVLAKQVPAPPAPPTTVVDTANEIVPVIVDVDSTPSFQPHPPSAPNPNTEKKSRKPNKRVEITVVQLREFLENKFNAMSMDEIFEFLKDRFTHEDIVAFLLKQVKADLELMI
jgi:uncharacterized protein YeeX (DUF496 family)